MAVMLERWNDDKMDAFEARVDRRFEQVDRRFDRIEVELRELRTEMKAGFDRMHRTMIQFGGALIVALFVALVSHL